VAYGEWRPWSCFGRPREPSGRQQCAYLLPPHPNSSSVPKHDRAVVCILALPGAGASPLPKRKTACILWSALLALTTIPSAASQSRPPPTGAHVRRVTSLQPVIVPPPSSRLLPCLCAGCLVQL
jgi:hypothetical protein